MLPGELAGPGYIQHSTVVTGKTRTGQDQGQADAEVASSDAWTGRGEDE